jgi:hypothetical protein
MEGGGGSGPSTAVRAHGGAGERAWGLLDWDGGYREVMEREGEGIKTL